MSISLKFLFSALAVSLILVGCGSDPKPQVVKKPLPAWINAPLPSDTQFVMYGMGIESDRDSAIKAALSDMVSKLGTTIESSFESNQEVQGSYVKSNIKNQIKADISKIKINNYKVIKSHKISYREFAVMIETDKIKFVKGLNENLDAEKRAIVQKSLILNDVDALSRYNLTKELSEQANKLLPVIFITSELDNSFDKKANLDFIAKRKKTFLDEAKNLKFYISGDTRSKKFVESIKNYIAKKGFNVSDSKNNAVEIKIKTSDNISSSNSISIAVLTLDVGVYDKSKRIGGKSFVIKERYNGSSASVYKNANIHLNQDIKSEGINKVIGINLNLD